MRISKKKCVKDIKCCNCTEILKESIDYRYGIISLNGKGLLMCKECFEYLSETFPNNSKQLLKAEKELVK